ncbi:ATP phosphoribosyltransferase [Algiphilus sp.]|uniref:ATP phosphoribosyltransferase n=2 Tax=Algiphilus sp. TaxID=1872431 RepID=UPI001CA794E0|nr:ATP phosphoribosyltransferase [Algiphilus acroporae]
MSASAGVTLALSKGRIFEESEALLAPLGLLPQADLDDRLLRLPSQADGVDLLVIRPSDVPPYVEHGAADFGIVGKDVLMEHDGSGLFEPLDLQIAQCRMVVAGLPDSGLDRLRRRPRIATKYPAIARAHFGRQGRQVEIIKLYGSMELAPLVGLADAIVDLVATGSTLRANGLIEFETIADISSRLVVNKAAMKTKHAALTHWIERFREVVTAKEPVA